MYHTFQGGLYKQEKLRFVQDIEKDSDYYKYREISTQLSLQGI